MKPTDTQLLEEAYARINEEADQYPPKVLKGPIRKTTVTNDYYVNFGGDNYLYRTTENESGKVAKEELFLGIGGGEPKPTPGSNIASYESGKKRLKLIRRVISQLGK